MPQHRWLKWLRIKRPMKDCLRLLAAGSLVAMLFASGCSTTSHHFIAKMSRHTNVTYAGVEGPRLGTRAESPVLRQAGCLDCRYDQSNGTFCRSGNSAWLCLPGTGTQTCRRCRESARSTRVTARKWRPAIMSRLPTPSRALTLTVDVRLARFARDAA